MLATLCAELDAAKHRLHAYARERRPMAWAKAVGIPKRCSFTRGSDTPEALRARRWSHVSRTCLRSCRVTGLECAASSAGTAAGGSVIVTVCVRKRLISLRRVWHRLQSPHRSGCVAGTGDTADSGGGEGPSIGRTTALTRRARLVSFPCAKHCTRSGHVRQSPMRAAYTMRRVPSCSVRRSCG
jgi:hypothetical protein